MAVILECVSVIIRKTEIEALFPGGLNAFSQQEIPNLTEDEHLICVSFMATSYAIDFIERIEAQGLPRMGETNSPIAMIVGEESDVSWLTIGECDGYAACWLSDYPPGNLEHPEPGFIIQRPNTKLPWRQCIAQLRVELLPHREPEEYCCIRGAAKLVLNVFERNDDTVFWAQRDLAQRLARKEDALLLRELEDALQKL